MGLDGKEDHAHAVFAGRGQRKTQAGTFALEKRMRNLDQHAGAIARLGIAPASPAVRQVDQDFDPLHDDVVGFFAGDVGHKADPARVMFIARIVKTLRFGQIVKGMFLAHKDLVQKVVSYRKSALSKRTGPNFGGESSVIPMLLARALRTTENLWLITFRTRTGHRRSVRAVARGLLTDS